MRGFFENERVEKAFERVELSTLSTDKTMVCKAAEGHKLGLCAFFDRKILYVCGEQEYLDVAEQLSQMNARVLKLDPIYDVVAHRTGVNASNVGKRIDALIKLSKGDYDAAVVTPKVLLQYLPSVEVLKRGITTLKTGKESDEEKVLERLTSLGYKRVKRAEEKGDVAMMGEVLEVFPPDSELPVRILFDFDEIVSIKYFQPDTMQGAAKVDTITLPPVSDLLADITKEELLKRVAAARGLQNSKATARTQEIINDIELRLTNGLSSSMVWLIPFMTDKLSTLFDYLPSDILVVFDEPSEIFSYLDNSLRTHADRVKELVKEGEALKAHLNSVLSMEALNDKLKGFSQLGFSNVNLGLSNEEKGYFTADSTPLPEYYKDTAMMVKDLSEYLQRDYQVILYCGNEENVEVMKSFLGEIPVNYSPKRLYKGFIAPSLKFVAVGTRDMCLSSSRQITKARVKRRSIAPREGDYVVHEEFGIGKCLGIVHEKTYVGEKDYVLLEYAKGEKVYVPVQQMDILELYAGAESAPKLSDISKDEFNKQKSKARTSIKKLAFDLLELYAKRENSKGYAYPSDSPLQTEFERAFEFEETPDQLQAISDVKADMEGGKVMDRLICGDVGFGKTEVALRAIFKTVSENKQVAFLAPTTILTEQHFMTVNSRLSPFGIRVACLNRFRTAAQVKEIVDDLKKGTLSVVVGTHRLLSKDIEFFDLGLLVLDEEQRFGVEHKEKIKTLRNNINVISMSATPIPRTLYMALSGIRDVSLLDTPPKGRKPVETVVCEYSDALMKDAVDKELDRGGQVFVLYNSVDKIYAMYHRLEEMFPDANVVVAHGQMNTKELESNIFKFYNKEADILLATTIIENGIDVPNANTLFVIEANRLGLSQMYQLKGRVGRSTRLARAVFTYPQNYVPSGDVEKRLSALADASELGSGYRLALMDLEIRGAGNVLGSEQHGHVERIGYEMYSRLLRETIAVLKGESVASYTNTEVIVSLNAYIPERTVSSERERLKLYKRIVELDGVADGKAFLEDFEEMYGTLPDTVKNLVSVSLVRVLGSRIGVSAAEIDDRSARLRFSSSDHLKSKAVLDALTAVKKQCAPIIADEKVAFFGLPSSKSEKMEFLIRFLNFANGNYDN